jgi:hypothetical protein
MTQGRRAGAAAWALAAEALERLAATVVGEPLAHL